MKNNVIDEIIQIKDVLPRKQKTLCNYLVLNYTDAGMMTVAELATQSGVGTTTVMRLIKTLQYENYGDFRRDLLNISLNRSTSSYVGIKKSFQTTSNNPNLGILNTLWNDTNHTIENFITKKNTEQVNRAVDLILNAGRVNLLGLRSSKTAAIYMESVIDRFYPKMRQLSNEGDFLYDRLLCLNENDVILIFSAWPCTKKIINVVEICRQQKVCIILITNTVLNPITRSADVVIDTNSVNCGCGILPLMFIAEAIIVELGQRLEPESTANLEKLEHELDQYDIFIK
ncbi:MAG: MurR/RpiR family transcriptional regulator [Clostridium sp.]